MNEPHPLTAYRTRHGLSRREVAARVGTTENNIGRYERRDRTPSPKRLAALIEMSGGELQVQDFVEARSMGMRP